MGRNYYPNQESRGKFNPILHNRQAVQSRECTDACETDCESENEHPLKIRCENQINKESHNIWTLQGQSFRVSVPRREVSFFWC